MILLLSITPLPLVQTRKGCIPPEKGRGFRASGSRFRVFDITWVRALPYWSRAWIVKADLAGERAEAVRPVPVC